MSGRKTGIEGQIESKLVPIKFQAAILIFDKDIDGIDAQVGDFPVQANVRLIHSVA